MNAVKAVQTFPRPIQVVNLLLVLVLMFSASSAFAAHGFHRGDTPGTPWTGDRGIVETVDQIMSREPRKIRDERESPNTHRHLPTEPTLQDNPLAPSAPQWPLPGTSGSSNGPVQLTPQTVGTSFLGMGFNESGSIPPDSMGGAGPTQILAISNGRIRSFSKTGGSGALNVTTDDFFASVTAGSGTSDPHVRYDRLSGRWFVVMINVAAHNNRILLAVSSGSIITNTSTFTFFQFQQNFDNGDAGLFADYPTLGVDKFALYIGVNNFLSSSGGSATRAGFVVNKASLLAGGPIIVTAFRNLDDDGLGNGIKTPQGVDNDDPAATEGYFIGVDTFSNGKLDIRRISDPGGTPGISPSLTLTVPVTAAPIPQAHRADSLGKKLDALGDRLFAAAIHKNKLTGSNTLCTAHNLEVDTNGVAVAGGGRNGSRWYEIGELTNNPVLIQAGTLFDSSTLNAKGYWIPSVAFSGQGHMALGCTYAASNAFAGIATSGRLRDDPLGSTQSPTLAVVSTTAYNLTESGTVHRWGDFSQVVVDPADDMTMWTFQEYCNAANSWGVRVIQLKAPPPATPISASPSTVTAGQSSVDIIVTGTSTAGSEFFDPGPDTGGPGYPNHIAASINGGGVTVNSITFSNITNITLNVSVSVCAAPGDRTITVTNPDGRSTTSASTLLTIAAPPCISAQPQNQTVAQGSNATFSVAASGTAPLSYQWRLNQNGISSATDSSYTHSNSQCGDPSGYDVIITNSLGSITSSVATLTVVTAPMITMQPPASQTINAGQTATFTVVATNDCGGSLNYQWRLQGTNITGAIASSYSRTNAQFADGGDYTVLVSTLASSVTSTVSALTVLSPPLITQQPQNQTVSQASNALFSVTAAGTVPFSYQWRFNQIEIPGATFTSYTRTNAQCNNLGGYDVVVTNAYGSVTSSIASLTVVTPPGMALQPTNQTVLAGQSVTFIATATNQCGGGLTYQWQFNGTNLAGAETNSLNLASAQPADAGGYALVVTNLAGSVTSAVATLTVIAPPAATFVAGPTNGFVPLTVSFTNLSSGATNYSWAFGDGNTSGTANPMNTYTNVGAFSVTLTAIGAGGTNSFTGTNYVVVSVRPSIFAPVLSGTDFVFSFQTIAAKTYTVQYKDSLEEPNWQTLQTVPGDGTLKTITNSTASPALRFYRLSVQ
jgi:hypothetical protein